MRGGRQQRSERGTTIGKAHVVLIGNTWRGGSHSLTLRGVVWKSFTMIPSSNLHCLFSFWAISISFKTKLDIQLNDMQVCIAFYYRMMYDENIGNPKLSQKRICKSRRIEISLWDHIFNLID